MLWFPRLAETADGHGASLGSAGSKPLWLGGVVVGGRKEVVLFQHVLYGITSIYEDVKNDFQEDVA